MSCHGIAPGLILAVAAGLDAVFAVGAGHDPDQAGFAMDGDIAKRPTGGVETRNLGHSSGAHPVKCISRKLDFSIAQDRFINGEDKTRFSPTQLCHGLGGACGPEKRGERGVA